MLTTHAFLPLHYHTRKSPRHRIRRQSKNYSRRIKNICRTPVRTAWQPANAIDPDLIVTSSNLLPYAEFQIISWILPMTIAGRLMKMEYENISKGLIIIGVMKTILYALDIIHY